MQESSGAHGRYRDFMEVGIAERALVQFCLMSHFFGKTRLENWLINRVSPRRRHPFGFDIELDPESLEERGLYFRCAEPDTTRFLRKLLRPGMTFLDCGSHVGFYSLLAAAGGCRVVAFEPSPITFDRLHRNVELNAYENVDCRLLALSDENCRRPIFGFPGSNTGMNTLSHGEFLAECEVVRLDDLDVPPPDIMKIDVEGSEVALLRGAARTISKHRPVIVIEVSGTTAAYYDQTTQDVIDAVYSLGDWSMYYLWGRRPVEITDRSLPHTDRLGLMHGWNYAFVPRGR